MSLGSRIKERREELHISRNDLAAKIGVTPSAIANYENEISSPRPEYMYRLFNALKCDANYLHQDELNAVDYCPERLRYEEMKHIGKYRLLDKYGKDLVDTVLDKELMRCKDTSGS